MINTLRSLLFSTILIVLLRNLLIFGQVTVNRSCRSYNIPNSTFELDKFQGKWYEIAKYGHHENCTYDVITHFHDTNRSNVTRYAGPYKNQNINTLLIEQSSNNSNDLIVMKENGNYTVKMLATDYNNYIIFWGCMDKYGATSSQSLVVLSKYHNKNVNNLSEVQYVLHKATISNDPTQLWNVDHSNSTCNKAYTFPTHNNTTSKNSTHHTTHSGVGRSENVCIFVFITILLCRVML